MGSDRFTKLFCRECQSAKREGFFFILASCSILEEQEVLRSKRVAWDVEFIALTVRFVPLAICQYTSGLILLSAYSQFTNHFDSQVNERENNRSIRNI